ncbi:hypothetical protein M514_00829 [Trichuris suis]|uniref:Uncharacterized protein n=1 Tax=Trichuris suis TaxID=68888 RepID=A0A085N080_9BILA|nr:hypothetical protein M513_00829 [Trichuris suis]KFD62876.1 hypothetical protein M514_00829 [Trichuris suis]
MTKVSVVSSFALGLGGLQKLHANFRGMRNSGLGKSLRRKSMTKISGVSNLGLNLGCLQELLGNSG